MNRVMTRWGARYITWWKKRRNEAIETERNEGGGGGFQPEILEVVVFSY